MNNAFRFAVVPSLCSAWLCYERGRTPDSQSREPGFESPFAIVSEFGLFRSIHDTLVHSAVYEYLAIDGGGNLSE